MLSVTAAIVACNPLLGIEERACDVCASDTSRLVCDEAGGAREEACPSIADACARPVCRGANQCGYEVDVGAECGPPDAPGWCSEQGMCVGPNTMLSSLLNQTCALLQDRSVWCWGENDYAQLGDGSRQFRALPTRVRNLPPALFIDVGYAHVCAVTEVGDLYCWGNNSAGQIDGVSREAVALPTRVPIDGVAFAQVSAGAGFTCALTQSADVYCWGFNDEGQCGREPSDSTLLVPPNASPILQNVHRVLSTNTHSCALLRSGELRCWGRNVEGELALDPASVPYSATPVAIELATAPIISFGLSWQSTYAATRSGALFAWGSNLRGQLGTGSAQPFDPIPQLVVYQPDVGPSKPMDEGAIAVFRTNGSHQCAQVEENVISAPRYICWGGNDGGELGYGALTTRGAVHPIAGAAHILGKGRSLVMGEDHGCMIDPEERILCWGETAMLGIGAGDPDIVLAPTLELVEVPFAPEWLQAGD